MTTPTQQKIFDYYRDRLADGGYCPMLRQVGDEFGISAQSVSRHVDKLVARGMLVKESGAGLRNVRLANVPDVRSIGTEAILAELARRGLTFGALDSGTNKAFSRAAVSCAADCCHNEVEPGRLFCLTHWRALPHWLQQAILAAHRARDIEAFQDLVCQARDIADGTRAA